MSQSTEFEIQFRSWSDYQKAWRSWAVSSRRLTLREARLVRDAEVSELTDNSPRAEYRIVRVTTSREVVS